MIINQEFNGKVYKKSIFLFKGILEIDCQYFIEKIKESCASEQ